MTVRTLLIAGLFALAIPCTATAQGVEARYHFEVIDQPSGLAYQITHLFQLPDETMTRNIYLLEDANGDRLMLTDTYDFLEQQIVYEVADLSTKEVVSATFKQPYKSATRAETILEMRKARDSGDFPERPITIELNGVAHTAMEDEWLAAGTRERRSALRRAATPQFLERLERLRPILGDDKLNFFCMSLLRYVFYNEQCDGRLKLVRTQPDCQFDATFRYPCSDKQKGRIAKAKESGKVLTAY